MSLESVNERLRASAFNAWLGIEAMAVGAREVRLRMPWRPELEGGKGMTHGGIFACMVDIAAFAMLLAARGGAGPTIDLRVDFHRNALGGEFLITSRLVRAGSRIATVDVRVEDAGGQLLASGRCVYIASPATSASAKSPSAKGKSA